MLDFDRSDFLKYLSGFPQQILDTRELMKNVKVDYSISQFQNLVIGGMGGSAIAGDLALAFSREKLPLPAMVIREYDIPVFVNKSTLFIALSYSGNTEETLSTSQQAIEKGATLIGISSGGELENICKKGNYVHIKIPEGYPPRQALGYLFFSLYYLLDRLGVSIANEADVNETVTLLQELAGRYDPHLNMGSNLASHIAQSIYHAFPVIYTGVPFLYPVPVRWRNQFNENSKCMAFSNVFPELNHNEIMGWEGLYEVNKHLRIILLRDPEETPRMKKRIEISKEVIRNSRIPLGEIFSEGSSRLARLFSLIYVGDWASYLLAMLNEKDPIRIDGITYLKEKLSELPA
ncbi:MAG: bifunctional phosphoglucose/phosphomannose isomerase [Calditrichaeota bacterium]|nr:MAG: bifunctional phosphoglucose/phosphomannose isomerase [Calditrichota bacterium]